MTTTESCPPPSASGIRLACAPVEASTVPATVYSLVRYGRLQDDAYWEREFTVGRFKDLK